VEGGAGLALLPDYLAQYNANIEVVLPDLKPRGVDMYFVYPEERRHSQRIAIFRDFLVALVDRTTF
jgi:DNA-binding transcriptional LysR family regulator